MLEYFADKYGIKISIMTEKQIRDALQTVVDNYLLTSKARSVNMGILYTFVTGSKVMDITDNYRRTLSAIELRYIKYKRDNALYDFTDLPLYLHDILVTFDDYINTVDALFVDEFQDVDTIQFKVFERVNASKKFFIGDGWQCQPAGTQILTCSGANVPIEEIKPGMEVMLYRGEKMKVQEIQKHTYFDNYMIQITSASGKSSRYTANHRTFVRFNEKFSGYILYLTSDKNGVMKTAICRGAEFFNDCNGDRI